LYEWAATALICALLLLVHRWKWREGQVGGAYFLLYGPTRFVIECFREHDPNAEMTRLPVVSDALAGLASWVPLLAPDGTVTYSQVVSLGLICVGVVWFGLATWLGPRVVGANR
jgi:prolipoprotein diacylglyceryltransferase